MTNHNRLELVIDQLLLDTKNPRYEELSGQEAALKERVKFLEASKRQNLLMIAGLSI